VDLEASRARDSNSATKGNSLSGDEGIAAMALRGWAEGGVNSRRLFTGGNCGDNGVAGPGEGFLRGEGLPESLSPDEGVRKWRSGDGEGEGECRCFLGVRFGRSGDVAGELEERSKICVCFVRDWEAGLVIAELEEFWPWERVQGFAFGVGLSVRAALVLVRVVGGFGFATADEVFERAEPLSEAGAELVSLSKVGAK
jgi:hypothetical protein